MSVLLYGWLVVVVKVSAMSIQNRSTNFSCPCFSFTGYINRLRGYHADRLKLPGFQRGLLDSYYYAPPENKMRMREYWPISGSVYAREFPTSWRNIDQGIEELWHA